MKVAKVIDYLSQLNWLLVAFTLLVFIGLIKLGFWQLSRAVEKEQRIARIEAVQDAAYYSLTDVLSLNVQENINDLPLKISGTFDEKFTFLLDNQTFNGQVGYRVLQVVSTNMGAVLVNMGWIKGNKSRYILPNFKAETGQHIVKGHVRLVESGITLAEQNYTNVTWPLRIQQIELDKFSHIIGQKLLPFVLYLDKKEDIGFKKNWQAIVMPPEKHRGYAFQWFSLATAWMLLMVSASLFFYKNQNNNN
ncbi:SURF1 family protein [Thalassotalea sediminis]|uniref:SURF1 family protein n=1 Tax=Thalassotalea sediminis TaxID=1759089 RepID=UPI002572310C|nr:SURF1 family protein [Thalassotalea sediminis]